MGGDFTLACKCLGEPVYEIAKFSDKVSSLPPFGSVFLC
ncbi:hypothetical protein LEP1GSC058_2752 [Leptospira fainei serovar Hurstbridge str. BUT 6]|uniref:Uncharacterized protein n=1 Tax=Leptospira fainei serovar Hurstbridge str. BUT 6 TaxID=1193011 RepID=S3W0W6_9LEPT|nr:hypothetical protein LEP1GSC058_2752 [Leptospira fainei serovar Hurstbridge str. BUT 6]